MSITKQASSQWFGKNKTRVTSGYKNLDSIVAGFRSGNTYVVAGLEKSGKSSLLMKMVGNMMEDNKVLFIDTELSDTDFLTRMASINTCVPIEQVEKNTNECSEPESTLIYEWKQGK